MNSIYVATNLAEDLIIKRCGIFVCRLCRSCRLFRYELITKPQVSVRWKPADNGIPRPCRVGDLM
jgi:hypothetical protein